MSAERDHVGRVHLVVGASRGLGLAIATDLAARGASVIGTIRRPGSETDEAMESAGRDGMDLEFLTCDVTRPDEVRSVVDEVLRVRGRIDGLVHSAGIWRGGRLEDLPVEDWRLVLETDLAGVFTSVQSVLPAMLAAGSGRIVVITSAIGLTGYPGDTAYSAAKGGAHLLVRSLAKEVARRGVAVNAVAPGPIESEMTDSLGEKALERLLRAVPIGRQGRPDELADVVAFLLRAPLLLTGAVIPLDGGMT
jgi:3-oxoacyl-[acyl-carrier protein] reductase